jgi:hypothetical protein
VWAGLPQRPRARSLFRACTITGSRLGPDAVCFAGAVEVALRDRAGWTACERAALKRITSQGIAPVIRARMRWFYAAGAHTFVVERTRDAGFTIARVSTN